MSNTDFKLHSEYLIKLLRAALNSECISVMPDEIPAKIDMKKIFYLAKLHSVAPAVYPVIKDSPLPAARLFEEEYKRSWRKNAIQYIELSNILSKTDEFSINCIPLKGSVLKYLYPSPEMRTMADIDFLYDGRKTSDILLIMYALGYTANPDSPNHHTFYKEPVMNVEFHENLFKKDNDFTEFFNPGWRYSKQTGKDKPLRELTDEGFYIYLVAHTAQHFHNGGAGIRNVMDVWVYLKKYKDTLDWKYIDLEFRRAGIYNFAENLKDLADIWFGSSKASPLLDEFGDYIIRSGTYGTRANQINNTLCKEGRLSTNKLRVIFRTIFPPYEIIKSKYPNAGKYPFLLPIYWIKNDLNALINRKQDIKYWIRTISKANEKKIKDHSEFMKNCGL